jgi:hypothetical protein
MILNRPPRSDDWLVDIGLMVAVVLGLILSQVIDDALRYSYQQGRNDCSVVANRQQGF